MTNTSNAEEAPRQPDVDDPHPAPPFPVVGIGASAGGLKALADFLAHAPPDGGIAYVVILHLSPDHESNAAAILQQCTAIPVTQVTEPTPLRPDHVYVIPPGRHLEAADGMLRLTMPAPQKGHRAPVDAFFRTLALTHGSQSGVVILSGSGSDGALGLKGIKEAGGVVCVQDPQEAEFDGMPRSAIATGMVDFVLPVATLPGVLHAFWRRKEALQLFPAPVEPDGDPEALRDILALLRVRTGHDFSQYKRPTVLRRLGRRMQVTGVTDLQAYFTYLHSRPDEVQALLQDMLISVTNFFRDHAAWQALQAVIPQLFDGKTTGDQVRVWVPGCATGEEAYTVAMLLMEHAATIVHAPMIQVFATDIDEEALAVARKGSYPETIAEDITPERLQAFFLLEQGCYRVREEVREKVLFAPHNLLRDAPFLKQDLITCRNVLIYLNREAQERVVQVFHFSLRPEGYLLLGTSESLDGVPHLFTVVEKKERLFRRRNVPPSVPPRLARSTSPASLRDRTLQGKLGLQDGEPGSLAELHQQLLVEHAPASVIVNEEGDIMHLSRGISRFLRFEEGAWSHRLVRVVHPDLRIELRTALFTARKHGSRTEASRVHVTLDGVMRLVDIVVDPLTAPEWARGSMLVLFNDMGEAGTMMRQNAGGSEVLVAQLEGELQRTKDQLRATVEQYESSVEEQKAANEELQAINEELRATTEELETSKEELQSVNEELTTVNNELEHNVDEVSRANSDLSNLIASTQIGTLFLDRQLRIKRYTPSVEGIFNLITTDIGRPFEHITHRLRDTQLATDAREVLTTLATSSRELQSTTGTWYLVRILPYRTEDQRIDGVVVTFVDITTRKLAEERLRHSEEHLQAMIGQAVAGIGEADLTGKLTFANDQLCALTGYTRDALLQLRIADITHPDDVPRTHDLFKRLVADGSPFEIEKRLRRKDGSAVWVHDSVSAMRDARGNLQAVVAVSIDISERKQGEATQAHFRQLFESAPGSYAVLEPDQFRILAVSNAYLQATMTERAKILGRELFEIFPDDPQTPEAGGTRNLRASFERVKAQRQADVMPVQRYPIARPDGTFEERWWSPINSPIFGSSGELVYIIHRVEDVTPFVQQMHAEGRETEGIQQLESRTQHMQAEIVLRAHELQQANDRLRESERIIHMATQAARISTWSVDKATQQIDWSPNEGQTLGLSGTLPRDLDDLFAMVDAAQRDDVRREFTLALDSAGHVDIELCLHTTPHVWCHLAGSVVRDANTGTERMVGVAQNITDRRKAEAERERLLVAERAAREEAEAAVRVRDQFLSIASHELRTPLTPLLGYIHMIEKHVGDAPLADPRLLAQTRAVTRQAQRINGLVGQLLDVSRLQQGQFVMQRRPLNLVELATNLIADYQLSLPRSDRAHRLRIESVDAAVSVLGDPNRLEEVMINLLANAVKYSPEGSNITVRVARQATNAILEVVDEGIGIPEEARAQIFDTFFRAGNVSPRSSGFGIGLYIVKKIVEGHEGRIEVESAEGEGSTFRVVLPLLQEAE